MKIRMVVTVDVDPEAWATEYGLDRAEVREDFREYVRNLLYGIPEGVKGVEIK